jgi:hypothetical protein
MGDPKSLRDSAAELRRWASSTRDREKAFRISKVADRLEAEAVSSETAPAPAETVAATPE